MAECDLTAEILEDFVRWLESPKESCKEYDYALLEWLFGCRKSEYLSSDDF